MLNNSIRNYNLKGSHPFRGLSDLKEVLDQDLLKTTQAFRRRERYAWLSQPRTPAEWTEVFRNLRFLASTTKYPLIINTPGGRLLIRGGRCLLRQGSQHDDDFN